MDYWSGSSYWCLVTEDRTDSRRRLLSVLPDNLHSTLDCSRWLEASAGGFPTMTGIRAFLIKAPSAAGRFAGTGQECGATTNDPFKSAVSGRQVLVD